MITRASSTLCLISVIETLRQPMHFEMKGIYTDGTVLLDALEMMKVACWSEEKGKFEVGWDSI
jgi:hypothetical protein